MTGLIIGEAEVRNLRHPGCIVRQVKIGIAGPKRRQRMIQYIERRDAELELLAFTDEEVLIQADIGAEEGWTGDIRKYAGAQLAQGWRGEASPIHILAWLEI